ncbi:MAG: pyruvate ferredoxin oxidoreductase [Candidatus Aenigmatarchaeota archaeon]
MDTHIVEELAQMVADGEIDAEYINVESEHSAMAACIGAQATGVRTYTATCGQGLAYMWELLYIASGMRLPIVMSVTNRALSSPLNIWGDWSDAMGARDTGWIQLFCENVQEAFDTTIQAYRIAEDRKILLPVSVNIDGFWLSHVYEPLDVAENVKGFVDEYKPAFKLDPKNPISVGEYATPEFYQEFKQVQQEAMDRSRVVIGESNAEFAKKFGRGYGSGLIDTFNLPAKYVIVSMGSICGTLRHVIERNNIKDIGLVRIRSFRPFPGDELHKVLRDTESIGVLEKNISLGLGGALCNEVRNFSDSRIPVSNFIGGLGGRDITIPQVKMIFDKIRKKTTGLHWVGENG